MYFSLCKQFLIPLKETRMKVSVLNFLEQWYELVECTKKTLFLIRASYLVTWVKIFMAPGSKGWSNILLMSRLLFIVPVLNTKLKRWFPKLKLDKTNLCCSYWCQLFEKYFDYGKRVGVRRLDSILAIKKWNTDKVRCTTE